MAGPAARADRSGTATSPGGPPHGAAPVKPPRARVPAGPPPRLVDVDDVCEADARSGAAAAAAAAAAADGRPAALLGVAEAPTSRAFSRRRACCGRSRSCGAAP